MPTALEVPLRWHLAAAVVLVVTALPATRSFLPAEPVAGHRPRVSAWCEPRTLALGLTVLAFALTEGAADDWLSLAIIDGYDTERWVGVPEPRG